MSAPVAGLVPLPYTEKDLVARLGEGWKDLLTRAYRWMLTGRVLDSRMLGLQRQGRVGFYGPATGHEATNVGTALALQKEDWVFPGLREQLLALTRGLDLTDYVHHLFTDGRDACKGRQMPCHPSARDIRYVSMSSTVGSQIIQATGCAYAQKLRKDPGITLACFGDGATSGSDFHAGMNFAGVYGLPVLFLCANNQWAISMPVEKQSALSVMAGKAVEYGFPGNRIDGTDLISVYLSVKEARGRLATSGPEMIEAVVYRMTPHTSSDDPTRYVPKGWMEEAVAHDPLGRLEELLERTGVMPLAVRESLRQELDAAVRKAVSEAEVTPPPGPDTLFSDTFRAPFWPLLEEQGAFDREQGGHFP